jgi:hypothetical protein
VATLDALPAGSEVVLFTFDDESRVVLPRTGDRAAVRRAIGGVRKAGRHTSLHDALYDVSRELAGVSGSRRAVLLITDGVDENSALNLEDGLAVAQQSRIPVFTVATGRANERVLRRIAKLTGGAYLAGAQRTPATLTEQLRRLPAPTAAVEVPPAPQARGEQPPVTSAAAPAVSTAPAGSQATTRFYPSGMLIGGVLVALGLAALGFLLLRGRDGDDTHACPNCGLRLAGALARCPHCERAELGNATVVRRPTPDLPTGPAKLPPPTAKGTDGAAKPGRFVPDISPTVLERLNMTEEYLDKTVTLRDRPVLVVSTGGVAGQVYDLSFETAISLGRSKANDIILNDVAVSSQHCRVRPEGDGFEVMDLNSTNGTWVNEKRVTRQRLEEGDKLRVGDTTMEFRHQHRYD